MSLQPVVKRRLSLEGCRKVGTQLHQMVQSRQGVQPAIPVDFASECQRTQESTLAFDAIQESAPMSRIDNGTDRCAGGLYNELLRKERCFSYEDVMPLTDEEKEYLGCCQRVRRHLFPSGVEFTKEPFHIEWNRLYELKLRMEESGVQKDLASLGMSIEASRLLRWIVEYGARLGITQAPNTREDPRLVAVASWHEGWETLVLEGRHALRKISDEGLKAFITGALSLFDQQVEVEAERERQRRARQEESAQEERPEDTSESD